MTKQKRRTRGYSLLGILFLEILLVVFSGGQRKKSACDAFSEGNQPAYHDHLPKAPLPSTLDPILFRNSHAAFVAYTLAAQIKRLLYQEPCYCPCRRLVGHQSLLECFTSNHGEKCKKCQAEAIYCFRQNQKNKSPAQIREGIARGEAWAIDFPSEVERLYREITNPQP